MKVNWYFCGQYCGEVEVADNSLIGALARYARGEADLNEAVSKAARMQADIDAITGTVEESTNQP